MFSYTNSNTKGTSPQPAPVAAAYNMDPDTPKKQNSPGVSAPVEAVSESQSQSHPAANISTSGPTTPDKQKTNDVSALGDPALGPQSLLKDTGPTTPQGQKSPDSPPLRGVDLISLTIPLHEFIRNLAMKLSIQMLKLILQDLIVRSASVMGCTHTYNLHFTPPTAEIRQRLSSFPDLDAEYVVDMTVSIMLAEWEKQCRHVIKKYWSQMCRDLLEDARKESEALKPKILEAVEARMKALEQVQSNNEPRPITPTPTARALPTTPTIDDISTAIGDLGIGSPLRIPRLGRQERSRSESPRIAHRTPQASPRHPAPSGWRTPQSQRSRNRAPMTPRPGLPGGSPLKACVPPGHEHAGMLEQHYVFSPVCSGRPPKFKLNPEN